MKKIIIILLLLTSYNSFSQNRKTYNGKFKDGKATYQYFETENLERIFDGSFEYSTNHSKTTGFYKTNKKTGKWSYSDTWGSIDIKATKANGNFENDKKNGLWTYYESNTIAKQKTIISTTITFVNDTIVGKIDFPKLKGSFDNKGKFVGKWNCKFGDWEFISEFKDNVLIRLIHRKISDGAILSRYQIITDSLYINSATSNFSLKPYKLTDEMNQNISNVYGLSDIKKNQIESIQFFFNFIHSELNTRFKDIHFFEFNFYVKNPELVFTKENTEKETSNNKPRGLGTGTGYR